MQDYADAVTYARTAHFGQYRRFTGEPYVVHPIQVARYMKDFGLANGDARSKAVLHDVVEDTDATVEDILRDFGAEVARSVFHLTDPQCTSPVEGLSKQEQLERYGRNIARGTKTDHEIKLCDILHNVPSMVMFAKHAKALSYVREKKFFLKFLTKADKVLYDHVHQMLIDQEALLLV